MGDSKLVAIVFPPGEEKMSSPASWMAHKYAGCVGLLLEPDRVTRLWAPRVPVLIEGQVRGFDPKYISPLGD